MRVLRFLLVLTATALRRDLARLWLAFAPYWYLAVRSFKRSATYRGATFAGVFTNTVFGFLKAYILLAIYRHRAEAGGLDALAIVTYTFLSQGFLAATSLFGQTEITDRIRTGDIVTDLYRPLHFQAYWASRDLGRAAFAVIFRGIPPFLIGALVFHLQLPGDGLVWLAFAVSLVLAIEVGFALTLLISLSGFWLIDTRGPAQLAILTMQFFSGAIVPISLFPGVLHQLAEVLPFSSIVQLPIEVFLSLHSEVGTLGVLGRQFGWLVALVALNEFVASRAMRRVVVQGG